MIPPVHQVLRLFFHTIGHDGDLSTWYSEARFRCDGIPIRRRFIFKKTSSKRTKRKNKRRRKGRNSARSILDEDQTTDNFVFTESQHPWMELSFISRSFSQPDEPNPENHECTENTSSLLSFARDGDWQKIILRSEPYASDLWKTDPETGTPNSLCLHQRCALHFMCLFSNPDICAIRTSLNAAPDTVKCVDDEGSTPLAYLCYYADCYAETPETLETFDELIKRYPDAVAITDNYGRTPLLHAIESGMGVKYLELILNTGLANGTITQPCGPTKLYQSSDNSRRDLNYLQKGYVLTNHHSLYHRTPLSMAWYKTFTRNELEGGKSLDEAKLLLKAAYTHKIGKPFLFFHALLEFIAYLPKEIQLRVLERTFRDGDMDTEGHSGRLPLNIVASVTVDSVHAEESVVRAIKFLLNKDQHAASKVSTNGRLALHEALHSGKTWGMKSFELLFKSNPHAMSIRDDLTGLYPFMLAASAAPVLRTDTSDDGDIVHDFSPKQKAFTDLHASFAAKVKEPLLHPDADPETETIRTTFELLQRSPEIYKIH